MRTAGEFLAERIGLRVDGATRARLDRVVRDAAHRAGCPQERFGRLIAEDPVRAQDLVDRVTVQESAFFRHPEQFELLGRHLRHAGGGVVWSAGCANGQEAWSLAMLLEEQGLTGWTVLATDVSAAAVARARTGTYAERELRGLSEPRRRRFVIDGAVAPRLRERVRFLHHNLALAAPPAEAGDCRVVLCRNVLIYLHRPAIERLLDRLRRRMAPDALLLLGMGEAMGPLDGFRAGPVQGAFLREPGSPAAARAAAPEEAPLPPLTALLSEGARLAAGGDLDAAALCFRRAGFLRPEDPRPRERLAAVLEEIARRG